MWACLECDHAWCGSCAEVPQVQTTVGECHHGEGEGEDGGDGQVEEPMAPLPPVAPVACTAGLPFPLARPAACGAGQRAPSLWRQRPLTRAAEGARVLRRAGSADGTGSGPGLPEQRSLAGA